MKIGVDIGGSHIGVGLVYKDKILDVRQKNFLEEDKKNIKKTIIDNIISMTNDILNSRTVFLEIPSNY